MENTIQFIEIIKRHEAIYDTTNKDYKNMEKKALAWQSVANEVGICVDACKRKWKNLRDSYTKYLRSYRPGASGSKKYQCWAHAEHMEFLRPFQGPGRAYKVEVVPEFASSLRSNDCSFDLNSKYDTFEKCSPSQVIIENLHNNMEIKYVDQLPPQLQHPSNHNYHQNHQQNNSTITTSQNHHNNAGLPSSSSPSTSVAPLTMDERNLLKQIELDATSMFFLSLAKSVRTMPRKYQVDVKMRCMKIISDVEMEIENIQSANSSFDVSNLNNFGNGCVSIRPLKNPINTTNNNSVSQMDQDSSLATHQQIDNSEHFLYVMSPSRVEAMIDISSDDE